MKKIIEGLQWIKANQSYGITIACDDLINRCKEIQDYKKMWEKLKAALVDITYDWEQEDINIIMDSIKKIEQEDK